MANSYVTEAAQALQPVIRQLLKAQGSITVGDIRLSSQFASIYLCSNLVESEVPAAILRAFRLAGLRNTGLRVANRAPTARYRKVSVWAAAA